MIEACEIEQPLARSDAVMRKRWKPSLSAWIGIVMVCFWLFIAPRRIALGSFQGIRFRIR